MIVSRRRLKLSLVAAAATMALTGCAGMHPGSAAVVDSSTISHDKVDRVAEALCAANISSAEAQGQPAPVLASRGAREAALQILLDSELSRMFGEEVGVSASPQQVSQAVAANAQSIALLPEDQKDNFRDALEEFATGQLILIEIGRRSLGPGASDDQAIAEGQRLRQEFVEGLEVEIDPRFGTFEEASFKRGGTSLSVPASERARAGDRAQPSDAWVSELPATQQCG